MKIIQAYLLQNKDWCYISPKIALENPLILVFGNRAMLEDDAIIESIRKEFPYEHIVFGSTSGEILATTVFDDSITVTAVEFEKASFVVKRANILEYSMDAVKLGADLFSDFSEENLKHLFLVSEGSFVNGNALIQGIESNLQNKNIISGGMCGDGHKFEKTLASYKENPKSGEVIMIGFYGDSLEFSVASVGGWNTFGPERMITKSDKNVLYEIDGLPALELYKNYLGELAQQLPQASLLYPLNVTKENKDRAVIRTVLSIDESNNSMTLAGDVPMNSKVQLMMASNDELVQGAFEAAKQAM
ncbi:MAG: FIST signal transduction protein, partial [Flavobacterium sp.]